MWNNLRITFKYSFFSASIHTGYKQVRQFSRPVNTVRHSWCNVLLPAETIIRDKRLAAETVRGILLPAETLGRKNHADGLGWKPFLRTVVLEGSKSSRTVSVEAKLWWTVLAESEA